MSPSAADSESKSEPSTVRLPQSTRTQLTDPTDSLDKTQTLPAACLGTYDPSAIPPSHDARTIVLCFDGTGGQFGADNSNVVRLFSMLKKDDKSQQVVYYQSGIGTAIANHLDARVMGGYEFLMENYHAEDKISIFGFSLGAYTARALAGMIHKVGLLPAGDHQQVPFAYKMFSRDDKTGWDQSNAFKTAFSVDVKIEFVGVWDTVCSVGIVPRTLPFTASNTSIRHFRHALSLDERRAKFKANHYHLQKPDDDAHDDGQTGTDVKEVWFAGCHCDIGGGSVPNGRRNSLARIPLRWMLRECFLANTGIQFYSDSFKDIGLDPATLYPFVTRRSGSLKPLSSTVAELRASAHKAQPTEATLTDEAQASSLAASTFQWEEDEELADIISPIHDQLKLSSGWWIVELVPLRHHMQDPKDLSWKPYWSMNRGRPRQIPEAISERKEKILVHRSVKTRMEAEGLEGGKYTPGAKFGHLDFEWVD